jgi:type II secretory pathway pseudopilin PulG
VGSILNKYKTPTRFGGLERKNKRRRELKMRRDKGITLVALIITIVVMLILVAVSINVIVNSDLIGHAEKTGDAYRNAIAKEEAYNPSIGNGKTLDDYMKDAKIVEEVHNWKVNGDKFTCTCDLCKAHANGDSSNGLTVEIGQEIKYKAVRDTEGAITTTITAAMSGHTENQTISLTAEPTYVVMGVADINENGTNETLLLTITKPEVKVTLKGAAAYNNGPTEINRMCRELYGKDARGMTIEDVNNCLGYINPKGIYYDKSGNEQTANNLTTKLSSLPIWNDIKNNHQTPDGRNTEAALGEYPLDGYHYSISSTEATEARKNLILASDTGYWLASRGVNAHAGFGYTGFGPGAVRVGKANSNYGAFSSVGREGEGGDELGLRPVVSLTSQIPEVVGI